MKNISFLSESLNFLEVKFSIYLIRLVFLMAPDKAPFFFFFFNKKILIFFLYLYGNICCGFLLEAPQ